MDLAAPVVLLIVLSYGGENIFFCRFLFTFFFGGRITDLRCSLLIFLVAARIDLFSWKKNASLSKKSGPVQLTFHQKHELCFKIFEFCCRMSTRLPVLKFTD